MSDKTIAAMTLALEALEHHGGNLPWNAFVEVRKDLREALAEQRLTNMQQNMERSIESLEAALVQKQAKVTQAAHGITEPTHA